MQGIVDSPWLDVSAVLSDDGIVNLVVVNTHPTQDFKIELDGMSAASGESKKCIVKASRWEVTNTLGEEQVGIEKSKWDGRGACQFAKMSMTMLRWRSQWRRNGKYTHHPRPIC